MHTASPIDTSRTLVQLVDLSETERVRFSTVFQTPLSTTLWVASCTKQCSNNLDYLIGTAVVGFEFS